MNKRPSQLTIQEISRKLDIPKSTLRFWENEFLGFLVPIRTKGGQRRYSDEHIAIIKEIKKLKLSGMSLENIKAKLTYQYETGNNVPGLENSIEYLADRVAEVVRSEVVRFFERTER